MAAVVPTAAVPTAAVPTAAVPTAAAPMQCRGHVFRITAAHELALLPAVGVWSVSSTTSDGRTAALAFEFESTRYNTGPLSALVRPYADAQQVVQLVRDESARGNAHAICCLGVLTLFGVGARAFGDGHSAGAVAGGEGADDDDNDAHAHAMRLQARGVDAERAFLRDCEEIVHTRGWRAGALAYLQRDANRTHPLWTADDALALFDLAAAKGSLTAQCNAAVCRLYGHGHGHGLGHSEPAAAARSAAEARRTLLSLRAQHPTAVVPALVVMRLHLRDAVLSLITADDRDGIDNGSSRDPIKSVCQTHLRACVEVLRTAPLGALDTASGGSDSNHHSSDRKDNGTGAASPPLLWPVRLACALLHRFGVARGTAPGDDVGGDARPRARPCARSHVGIGAAVWRDRPRARAMLDALIDDAAATETQLLARDRAWHLSAIAGPGTAGSGAAAAAAALTGASAGAGDEDDGSVHVVDPGELRGAAVLELTAWLVFDTVKSVDDDDDDGRGDGGGSTADKQRQARRRQRLHQALEGARTRDEQRDVQLWCTHWLRAARAGVGLDAYDPLQGDALERAIDEAVQRAAPTDAQRRHGLRNDVRTDVWHAQHLRHACELAPRRAPLASLCVPRRAMEQWARLHFSRAPFYHCSCRPLWALSGQLRVVGWVWHWRAAQAGHAPSIAKLVADALSVSYETPANPHTAALDQCHAPAAVRAAVRHSQHRPTVTVWGRRAAACGRAQAVKEASDALAFAHRYDARTMAVDLNAFAVPDRDINVCFYPPADVPLRFARHGVAASPVLAAALLRLAYALDPTQPNVLWELGGACYAGVHDPLHTSAREPDGAVVVQRHLLRAVEHWAGARHANDVAAMLDILSDAHAVVDVTDDDVPRRVRANDASSDDDDDDDNNDDDDG